MVEEKPRYSRVSDIIDLILLMQSKFNGVSLQDIQEEFKVSRRTAERMRDSVINVLPQVEEIETGERQKRWGFRRYSLNELVAFTPDDIAILEGLKDEADDISKDKLGKVITKLKALNNRKIDSIENEIEFILHSEGFAVKQAPSYDIDLEVVSTIREAFKNNLKLSLTYNNKARVLEPLGLMYGEKIHLVARERAKGDKEYNYLLHKLKDVKLTNETFDPEGFNIQEYAKNSFGVYQGEIYNVKLRFAPEVREDVLHYKFHPTQKMKVQEDGSVIVTFKASGDRHIIWHVFRWGKNAKILAPVQLKQEYKKYLEEVLAVQRGK